MANILEGIRVLGLTIAAVGPWATQPNIRDFRRQT